MSPFLVAAFFLAQVHAAEGRCVGPSPTSLLVVPAQPPLLSFRLYEGRQHYREAGLDLMLDDAGH
jgi:hypothetical protein